MEITSNKEEMIFRKDYNGNIFYSIGMSKKKQDGKYENGYMNVSFKKGVTLDNKTKIKIKNAWLDFYIKDNKTVPFVFISDFDVVEQLAKEVANSGKETNPYEEFANSMTTEFDTGEQIQIKPEDLPF